MKFLCVVYEEPNNGLGPQTEKEADDLVNEHLDYDETLRQSGHWLIAQALQPVETATTVRCETGRFPSLMGHLPRPRKYWADSC